MPSEVLEFVLLKIVGEGVGRERSARVAQGIEVNTAHPIRASFALALALSCLLFPRQSLLDGRLFGPCSLGLLFVHVESQLGDLLVEVEGREVYAFDYAGNVARSEPGVDLETACARLLVDAVVDEARYVVDFAAPHAPEAGFCLLLPVADHVASVVTQDALAPHELGHVDDLLVPVHDLLLTLFDSVCSALASVHELILLSEEVVLDVFLLLEHVLVQLEDFSDVHADGLGHDELAPQTIALVEFPPEPCQLSHDLQELALRLGVLVLYSLLLCDLLRVELLQALIFL